VGVYGLGNILCVSVNGLRKFIYTLGKCKCEPYVNNFRPCKMVKTHYGDTFWGVTSYYFPRVCMLQCITSQTFERISHYFCTLCYNITYAKYLKRNYFISFYKVGDWNVFLKTNVVYLCTYKHKCIPKIIYMVFNIYESWRYIEPCHLT
jgi:hypothetical protein